jgi:hypothetical protein
MIRKYNVRYKKKQVNRKLKENYPKRKCRIQEKSSGTSERQEEYLFDNL